MTGSRFISDDAWWAEPFDHQELKRRGFTYREVRELERIRMDAIPAEVQQATRAWAEAMAAKFSAVLDTLHQAVDQVFEEDGDA